MRYDSGQFGAFDGKDNRRELIILFQRLGEGLPEQQANEKRAEFLRQLVRFSGNGFADKMVKIDPCDALTAYWMFVNITGCLGVPVEKAAKLLDEAVTKNDRRALIWCP